MTVDIFLTKTPKRQKIRRESPSFQVFFVVENLFFSSKWSKVADQSETSTSEKSTRSQLVKKYVAPFKKTFFLA